MKKQILLAIISVLAASMTRCSPSYTHPPATPETDAAIERIMAPITR